MATALLWVGGALGAQTTAPPSPAPVVDPAIVFQPAAVEVEGLTPGGEAVLFALSREPQGYYTRVVRREEPLVADATGLARLDLPDEVPYRSVWVVVDLPTGESTVSSPGQFPIRELELGANALRRGATGRIDRLVERFERLEVLLVRPGAGAWRLSLVDGGEGDAEGAEDGSVTATLADLRPVGASPVPPEELASGDVLVGIDPSTLSLFLVRLAG